MSSSASPSSPSSSSLIIKASCVLAAVCSSIRMYKFYKKRKAKIIENEEKEAKLPYSERSEDPNDPFDRQRCLPGWDQQVMENQVCLILGVGGLGTNICLALARMGVKKLFLLDMDIVEVSNLNRNLLYSNCHVGMRKVDAAESSICFHDVGQHVQIEKFHGNVLENWNIVVKWAKQSTVIFNNIDAGEYYDYAVLSLARSLALPCLAGSSYGVTYQFEHYSGRTDQTSFGFYVGCKDETILQRLHPELIQAYPSISHMIPNNDNPSCRKVGSNVLVCATGALMIVNSWVQVLMNKEISMPNYLKTELISYFQKGGVDAYAAGPPGIEAEPLNIRDNDEKE